jgi:uncharacterized membrane protein
MKDDDDVLARALGWLGIGLGAAQLLAPRAFGRSIGVAAPPWLVRLVGLREIAAGVGLLTQPEPAPWVEARAVGDLVDLALLGVAFNSPDADRTRLAAAAAATAGMTALDLLYGVLLERSRDHDVQVRPSVLVARPRDELYAFWRKLENLPRFMRHLESVTPIGPNRWHWVARGPLDTRIEWDAEIIDDRPGGLIAWRSLEGSDFDNWGAVTFIPAGSATVVRVEMGYRPPRGALRARAARLFGRAPERQASADLRAFKSLMETRPEDLGPPGTAAQREPLDQPGRV